MNSITEEMKKQKEVQAPSWTPFVKTGAHKQRVPANKDWWFVRVGSILGKVEKYGPIGTNRLAKHYGGRKNRGHKPEKKYNASRNIIRKCIQQLEKSGLIKQVKEPKSGKILTKEGRELLKKVNK